MKHWSCRSAVWGRNMANDCCKHEKTGGSSPQMAKKNAWDRLEGQIHQRGSHEKDRHWKARIHHSGMETKVVGSSPPHGTAADPETSPHVEPNWY